MKRTFLIVLTIAIIPAVGIAGIDPRKCRDGSIYSEDLVTYLQEVLIADGALKGAADGKLGPATKAAFGTYREKHGLPRAVGIDLPLLKSLLGEKFSELADRDFRLELCAVHLEHAQQRRGYER